MMEDIQQAISTVVPLDDDDDAGEALSFPANTYAELDYDRENGNTENFPFSLSESFVQSLPVLHALPEMTRRKSAKNATHVVPIDVAISKQQQQSRPTGWRPRASLISVQFFKVTVDMRLGIRFKSINGRLAISSFSPTGELASSPLRPNDRILSLDGNSACQRWTCNQAVKYLKSCLGFTTILAMNLSGDPNTSIAAVYKSHPDDRLGIVLHNDGHGKLRIKKLQSARLLGGDRSILQVGDYVESINNTPCSEIDTNQGIDMIRTTQSLVTIRIKDMDIEEIPSPSFPIPVGLQPSVLSNSSNRHPNVIPATATEVSFLNLEANAVPIQEENEIKPGLISVMVYKPTKATTLGVVLSRADGDLKIARLTEGLLSTSTLRRGYHLLSINNVSSIDWSVEEVIRHLQEAVGEIHILASNPKDGDPNYVQAIASKASPRAKVGLKFKRSDGRCLKIGDVMENGLFANSVLNTGDDVITVNNIPTRDLRPTVVVDVVKRAMDTVSILAKTHGAFGVVLSQRRERRKDTGFLMG
jgi:C-terminal processing protease CtpA/Prc